MAPVRGQALLAPSSGVVRLGDHARRFPAGNRLSHPPSEEPGVLAAWQRKLHEIIFEAETPAGKAFDVVLLIAILVSVVAVMLDSVESIASQRGWLLAGIEWTITILFTIEYVLRLVCVRRPWRYALSFFGIVDLLAILPSYLSFFVQGSHALATIRTLRLIRVFRVFKMGRHMSEANTLLQALRQTRPKITVFVSFVGCAIIILGTLMYLLERDQNSGFDSIGRSVYWAIVTMTTVGYGDIAPQTVAGQTQAAVIMLLGYAIIVVPTGIFSAEVISARTQKVTTQSCPHCSREGHDLNARYCKHCGGAL